MQRLSGSRHAYSEYTTPHVHGPTIGRQAAIARASLASLTAPSTRQKSGGAHVHVEEKETKDSEIILWCKIFAANELPNKGKRRRSVRRTAQHEIARAEGRQDSGMGVESHGV